MGKGRTLRLVDPEGTALPLCPNLLLLPHIPWGEARFGAAAGCVRYRWSRIYGCVYGRGIRQFRVPQRQQTRPRHRREGAAAVAQDRDQQATDRALPLDGDDCPM